MTMNQVELQSMEVPNPDRLQVAKLNQADQSTETEIYDDEDSFQSSEEEIDLGELWRSSTTPGHDVIIGNQHYHIIDKDIICTEYAPDVFAHTR